MLAPHADRLEVSARTAELFEVGEHVMHTLRGTLQGIYDGCRLGVRIALQITVAQVVEAFSIVIGDCLRQDIRQSQQESCEDSGAILPGYTMKQQGPGR